jgi:hypothetical protein
MKHAWLTRTKHLRPGIPAGLSLEEAQKMSTELKQQILGLLKQD